MKRAILIVLIVGMVGWAVYDFVISSDTSQVEEATEEDIDIGLKVGNQAPNFTLRTLDGEEVSLSDFKGERVMVNFWATWCAPCRAEIPDMNEFYEDTDIRVLAVNVTQTEDNIEQVEKFAERYEMVFPVLLDEENSAANTYQIQPIPTSYMIDSEGIIQFEALGAMNYDLMVKEYEKMN